MVKELHQNPQTFITAEFFVKIAIRLLSLSETTKSFYRLFHGENINLAAALSERI
jgi:hypothetical protein